LAGILTLYETLADAKGVGDSVTASRTDKSWLGDYLCREIKRMSKVWFITGAGRGMGVYIANAALAAGHNVVATGRHTDKVAAALGNAANLLVVKLDITKPADAASAVTATLDKFGRIDVLVNNAANFLCGVF
jgi:short-subunit dehydrogenase